MQIEIYLNALIFISIIVKDDIYSNVSHLYINHSARTIFMIKVNRDIYRRKSVEIEKKVLLVLKKVKFLVLS